MFTAKILYCLWCTLAEPEDSFVLEPTMPLESTLVEDPIAFIRQYILEKTNEEIVQVPPLYQISSFPNKHYYEFFRFILLFQSLNSLILLSLGPKSYGLSEGGRARHLNPVFLCQRQRKH